MTLKPRKLRAGGTIGVIAPASPSYDMDKIKRGIVAIEQMGFKVVEGSTVYRRHGYLAGYDRERAQDINSFFARKDVDAILCLRGGYGTLRILDSIDYRMIKKNPKVFIGYSDITAIHLALNNICGMVTFHGPMLVSDFGGEVDECTRNSFLSAVTGGISREPIKMETMVCGKAEGRIIGGNLTVILSTLGTPYEIDTDGKILILEENGEEPYRVDRMLTQLMLSGKMKKCSGIVLGQFTACGPKDEDKSLSLRDVFTDRLIPLKIPILYGGRFGHVKTNMTIPLGVKGVINEDGSLTIAEEGVV